MQRNFEPMQRRVENWRQAQITDERAKLILCGFCRGRIGSSAKSPVRRCTAVFATGVPGILFTHDVEFIERIYQELQETLSAAQKPRKAWRSSQPTIRLIPNRFPFTTYPWTGRLSRFLRSPIPV
jgi:hypothetical protein